MDNIKRNPEYRNYAVICEAIAFVEKRLKPYTERKLQETHQVVYQKVAGMPACTQQCSVTFKNQTAQWCASCKSWKNLLLNTKNSQTPVHWEKMHSHQWPNDYEQIVGVYLPASRDTQDFQDLSTACYIWRTMISCKISPAILKRIRDVRNQSYAHNSSKSNTHLQKSKAFDAFRDLFKNPDVTHYIDTNDCMRALSEIENGVGEDRQLSNIENLLQHQWKIIWLSLVCTFSIMLILVYIVTILSLPVLTQEHQVKQYGSQCRKDVDAVKCAGDKTECSEGTCQCVGGYYWNNTECVTKVALGELCPSSLPAHIPCSDSSAECIRINGGYKCQCKIGYFDSDGNSENIGGTCKQECMSEQYSIPFPQDLPLLPYLSGHTSFIGREWLFKDLHNCLLSDTSKVNLKGIILAAEMGYGKSAIVNELLCAKPNNEQVQEIRQHIAAFHVCKFDVEATRDPGRFIRRLVGLFSMKSAEYGNYVSMLPDSSLLYDKESCKNEPDACFDQGVTFSLKHLKTIKDPPWIIVIEALDECETSGHNAILELLIRRTKDLPKWIKLVVTSRNMTSLTRLRRMKINHLKSNDSRNHNDLKTFINLQLTDYLETGIIDDLLAKRDGNFVYIVQAVSWLRTQNDTKILPKLPADLGDVYEREFDRHFGYADQYVVPKMILEIVCSTIHPVNTTDISVILKGNGALYTDTEFNNYLNVLFFVINVDGGVRIKHQALFYWLTSETNLNYRISLQAGHTLISTSLFRMINTNKSVDIVDLAIHICNSEDLSLKRKFVSSPLIGEVIVSQNNLLHKLIWKTSAVKPLKLILAHEIFVDRLNEGNVTAAFVAALKGNVEQLKLLHKKGADINFRVLDEFNICCNGDEITLDSNFHYYGYTLLHIAAQHGHLNVVRYLLHKNSTLAVVMNPVGMQAGHIACKHGHFKIIKEITNFTTAIFDSECLYYAITYNHAHLREWLVSRGATFNFIPGLHVKTSAPVNKPINIMQRSWVSVSDKDNVPYKPYG